MITVSLLLYRYTVSVGSIISVCRNPQNISGDEDRCPLRSLDGNFNIFSLTSLPKKTSRLEIRNNDDTVMAQTPEVNYNFRKIGWLSIC